MNTGLLAPLRCVPDGRKLFSLGIRVVITDNDSIQKPPFFWQKRCAQSRGSQGRRPTMTQFDGELSPPFEIVEPAEWRAPIIFNSPHSGSVYPEEFLTASRIDVGALRRSEDSFMDELIGGLSDRGFPTVRVNFPRSYVDVNRSPTARPRMFSGRLRVLPTRGRCGWPAVSAPSAGGRRRPGDLSRAAVGRRRAGADRGLKPYHRALRQLINKAHQAFGTVIVVDCHSMPSIGVSRD